MAIQDALHLTWSSVNVRVAYLKSSDEDTAMTDMSAFDFSLHQQYLATLEHPGKRTDEPVGEQNAEEGTDERCGDQLAELGGRDAD